MKVAGWILFFLGLLGSGVNYLGGGPRWLGVVLSIVGVAGAGLLVDHLRAQKAAETTKTTTTPRYRQQGSVFGAGMFTSPGIPPGYHSPGSADDPQEKATGSKPQSCWRPDLE